MALGRVAGDLDVVDLRCDIDRVADDMTHPLYKLWNGIRQRCRNPKCKAYPRYGGRGVRLSSEWDDFRKFIDYVESNIGERPNSQYSLDRIDVNKGYEPGNIRWATHQEQERNKRPYARGSVSWKYRRGYDWDPIDS